MIWNGDCSFASCEREAIDSRSLCREHLGLGNPGWLAPVAFGGAFLVAFAVVLIFAAMWAGK